MTKQEMLSAYRNNRRQLGKAQTDLAAIQNGEKVENLTEAGALRQITGLKGCIDNLQKALGMITDSECEALLNNPDYVGSRHNY